MLPGSKRKKYNVALMKSSLDEDEEFQANIYGPMSEDDARELSEYINDQLNVDAIVAEEGEDMPLGALYTVIHLYDPRWV